jgi:hypothetical protein
MTPTNIRFQKLMNYYKIPTIVALNEIIGLERKNSTINFMIKGQRNVSRKFALKMVENFPEINLTWLLTGEGEFLSIRPTDPVHHKLKKVENELYEMKNKIDFVYNLRK